MGKGIISYYGDVKHGVGQAYAHGIDSIGRGGIELPPLLPMLSVNCTCVYVVLGTIFALSHCC